VQTVTSSRREQGRPGLYRTVSESQQQVTDVRDLRSLADTKRALDDRIETLTESGKRQEARALKLKGDEFVAKRGCDSKSAMAAGAAGVREAG
jgi:hypothetical protein